VLLALNYARAWRARFVDELAELVRFPSVSAQPERAEAVSRCANWLAAHFQRIGFREVDVITTIGHPIVRAVWRGAPGRGWLLIYGHYDVQPVGPPAPWRTPPFGAVRSGEHLYGRGASDDKGQMFAHLKALESWLASERRLPLNVVCVLDGEEEVGSPSLQRLMHTAPALFRCGAAVVSDMAILGPDTPAITYALRGSVSLELSVLRSGPALHSGIFGGAIGGAVDGLAHILAGLHTPGGRISIPGFYDDVLDLQDAERANLMRTGPGDADILERAGATSATGEQGYTVYERTVARPSLVVTGLVGGYTGRGPMSIIPAQATAKLNLRLVPTQDANTVETQVRGFVSSATPPGLRARLETHAKAGPVIVDVTHPVLQVAAHAYHATFGRRPRLIRNGGTIPIVSILHGLRIPVVLMGFALPDDGPHGPDERLHLPTFQRGVETSIRFLQGAAEAILPTPAPSFWSESRSQPA
jgi:acetylornithine deacetylase/succinyl-diaminopimelate desuccinylase-like protein